MEDLFFLRHGIAYDREEWSPADGNRDDGLRPLTEEGIRAMQVSAAYLQRLPLKFDAIITSPLVRAAHTAEILHSAFPDAKLIHDDALMPGFGYSALRKLVKHHDAASRIVLVGHEPDFSDTISDVIGGGHVIMKKGSLARITLRSKAKSLRGDLMWLLTPETLTAQELALSSL